MGKGPAVIRLIERWKCRQKKWLEIIAVLKTDTCQVLRSQSLQPAFLRGPVQQSWCIQTLGPAGAWRLLAEISPQAVLPATTPWDKSAPPYRCSSVVPTEVGREGGEYRLARWQCTNCQVSLMCTEEEILFFKSFHHDIQNTEYFQIWN